MQNREAYVKNKHDHRHTLKIYCLSATWKNCLNLLLKNLTEKKFF